MEKSFLTEKIAFIAFYHKKNIFSLNAIIAAIETSEEIKDIKIFYLKINKNYFKNYQPF